MLALRYVNYPSAKKVSRLNTVNNLHVVNIIIFALPLKAVRSLTKSMFSLRN